MRETLISQFALELRALGGQFERVHSAQAIPFAAALLKEKGVERVLAWADEHLPPAVAGLSDALRREGFELIDQLVPRHAAALSSSNVIPSGEAARNLWAGVETPRASGARSDMEKADDARRNRIAEIESAGAGITGADAAIAQVGAVAVMSGAGRGRLASLIVPLHLIFVTPDQFYPTLADWWPNVNAEPSNITLIAGPSRTSDIERVLTLGVHGPKEVIVICVD